MSETAIRAPAQRFRSVNWIGLRTLYVREVRRFLKVAAQTVTGPIITTLLFLAVFSVALARRAPSAGGVPYVEFLAPGLIMMTMAQNAFANTSSSILIAKVQGNIADFLMAPLGPGELTWGFALGGLTRGLLVGVALGLAMWPFVPFRIVAPGFLLFHAVAAVTNFVVTPLTLLSGTFYSVEDLPGPAQTLVYWNPYMIDGFRYGLTGHADGSLTTGIAVMIAADLAAIVAGHRIISTGWRLKP